MLASPMGMIFPSNSSSSSGGSEEDDDDEEDDDEEGEPSTTGSSHKRKRGPGETSGSGSGSHRRMMELFEGLMKQVMQKQEEMQKRFLEAIEKREQDRMIREEAWRRQEMARLAQEHEIAAQERAASASRDAAIVSFLQTITGQTIHLPTTPATVTTGVPPLSSTPPPRPQVQPTQAAPHPQPRMPPPPTYQEQRQQQQQRQNNEVVTHPLPASTEIIMAVPEQQVPPQSQELILSGGSGREPLSSSRWPKVEVLELIKLRSGLESRYQEAGPKGPLWEEISAGMARMGYKRSAKRCKEKWENINKYFKKVKESNKKRPEDAKTCPYFHELDALYRRKVLGGGGATSGAAATSGSGGFRVELSPNTVNLDARPVITKDQPPPPPAQAQAQASEPEHKDGGGNSGAQERIAEEGSGGSLKKPEDTVKEIIGQGPRQNQHSDSEQRQLRVNSSNYNDKKMEEGDSDDTEDQEENEMEEDDEENDEDEELEEERKMAYKIEFQRPNASAPPNSGGNGAPSFLAMVQ
ncbi:Myb-like domain-containing protein [Psidium guajava]|nr:Myb-like domain-containing protein [Psidium guajava]